MEAVLGILLHKLYALSLDVRPEVGEPLCTHTHTDSDSDSAK